MAESPEQYFSKPGSRFTTEKILTLYAAAAGSVGLVANAADAAVIYSGLQNVNVAPGATYELDMDGNGLHDFTIVNSMTEEFDPIGGKYLTDASVTINSVAVSKGISRWAGDVGAPYRLAAGEDVASQTMQTGAGEMARFHNDKIYNWTGDFVGAQGYLGVGFKIAGEMHYGWIQARVSDGMLKGDPDEPIPFDVTIIDWGYEEVAGRSILAGDLIGLPGEVDEPETLALLAAGAGGLLAWRRRKQARRAS